MAVRANIIGNGAIGSLLAARCAKLNLPFNMWWREFSDKRITVNFLDGSSLLLNASKPLLPLHIFPQSTQLLLIPTKAWQVEAVLEQYHPYITANTCIVLLHNGIGTEELVLSRYNDNPILRITTSKAALKLSGNIINETGKGASQAGWLRKPKPEQLHEIQSWFSKILEDCHWFDDIRLPLWQKLAINCVINPLTTVHNIKNGELLKPQYRSAIESLLEEFFLVTDAEKLPLEKAQITKQVWSVIKKTADNYSSMHQDVMHNRKTEIDYINGFLLARAAKYSIDLKFNQSLVTEIKKLSII